MNTKPLAHIAPIDGLRAIAVLAVLLFHLGVAPFGGGYIGVDVFFVISGYLMVRIIGADMDKGRYSALNFLSRRFARLAPALIVASAATLFAASLVYVPESFPTVWKSALAASAFVSNLYFWQVTNYFDNTADVAPFLHTWSLGLEAQFYVALAAGMAILGWLGVKRLYSRAVFWVFIVAMAGSLTLDIVMTNYFEKITGSFYFPLTRFWELLLGSVVALVQARSRETLVSGRLLSLCGLGILLFAIIWLDKDSIFPGLNALLPCLATAMLLLSFDDVTTAPARLLSSGIFQFVGRISYSVYLWHWPLIVIYRYAAVAPLNLFDMALLFVASILLGWLSYVSIERPFRRYRFGDGGSKRIAAGLAVCACLVIASFPLQAHKAQRIAQNAPELKKYMSAEYRKDILESYSLSKCFVEHDGADAIEDDCLDLNGRGQEILLLGDSHAAHLLAGLRHNFPGVRIAQANVTGCRSLIDSYTAAGPICKNHLRFLFDDYLPTHKADLVVLAGRWKQADLPSLQKTLRFLKRHGHNTLLIGPAIEYLDGVPSLFIRQSAYRRQDAHKIGSMLDVEVLALSEVIRDLAVREDVSYVSIKDALCNSDTCDVFTRSGSPFQWDYGHYTEQGSLELVERLSASIKLALLSKQPTKFPREH